MKTTSATELVVQRAFEAGMVPMLLLQKMAADFLNCDVLVAFFVLAFLLGLVKGCCLCG